VLSKVKQIPGYRSIYL